MPLYVSMTDNQLNETLIDIYGLYFQVHLHAGTDEPLNVTFMRAPSSALLKIDVPLMYIGDDASPGLRKGM